MKRREIVLALIGAALLYFSGGKLIHRSPLDRKQITIGETCRTPATIFQLRDRKPQSTVVVFHGLSANRHVMYYLGEEFAQAGARVYLLDFPGHGDSTESFTFAHAEQCASEAIGTLIRNGEVDPDKTALVGHSMGGAIAIRLADQFPTAATIAISPAPLVLPHRIPSNLLVFTAQFDIPILKGAARHIARAAQGNRTEDSDFWERRAFELKRVAYATHSSLIVDWRVTDKSLEWIKRSFAREHIETIAPGDRAFPLHGMIDSDVGEQTQGGALIGLLGLLMIFPLAATAIAATFRQTGAGTPATSPSMPTSSELLSHSATNKILLQWAVAAFIAVCIMTIAVPLHPILRQFSGDYLASLLLLASAHSLDAQLEAIQTSVQLRSPIIRRRTGSRLCNIPRDRSLAQPATHRRMDELASLVALRTNASVASTLFLRRGIRFRFAARFAHSQRQAVRILSRASLDPLAGLRICVPRHSQRSNHHHHSVDHPVGTFLGPAAPRSRCVAPPHWLHTGNGSVRCYTRCMVFSCGLSADVG